MSSKDLLDPEQCPIELLKILARAFDQMDAMAGVINAEGTMLFANRSALTKVGATLGEIVGKPFRDSPWRKHSEEAKRIADEMIAAAISDKAPVIEDAYISTDGENIPGLFSMCPVCDTDGNIIALIPEGKVILEQKALQKKLERERWEIQQWIDSMGSFVLRCDPEGRILSCNRPLLQALNMDLDEVIDQNIFDLVQPGHASQDRERVREAFRKAGHGVNNSLEVTMKFAGWSHRTFLFSISPILDEKGEIAFVAAEAIDISEQVRLREMMLEKEREYSGSLEQEVNKVTKDLREAEQFNKNVVDSVPLGIIYLDEKGRVVFVNPEMERKLKTAQISGDNIRGKSLFEIGICPANKSWEKTIGFLEEESVFGQMRMILNSGEDTIYQFDAYAAPFRSSSEGNKGTILVMNDITQRNRLEAELLRTRIQTAKLSSLGRLISGVAHEINNPLTSIIGCAEFLVESGQLHGEANEAAGIIVDDARRTGKIVKNLLTFARQSSPKKTSVNLNKIISNILAIHAHELRDNAIRSILDLDESIPPVEADVTQVEQVILNLMNNAIEAMEESNLGNKITIRTRTQGEGILFEIEDNGPGIPKEHLPNIFDPFFTTKGPTEGTGLGLSIAYSIMEKHGGSLVFESDSQPGARFRAYFPLKSPINEDKKTETPVPCWIPSSVLVVDDERNICLSLSKYLVSLGCEVDTALSAREALNKIRNRRYDLLLVDMKMPTMNGLEFYQKLQAERPDMAARFAFISGVSGEEATVFGHTTGVPLLQKPFSRSEILQFFVQLEKAIAKQSPPRSYF